MSELATHDARAKRRNGAACPVLVSGTKLAGHFGLSRQHVERLAQQAIIERRPDGLFDQDVSRLRYFGFLRAEHRRSPKSEADAEHQSAKAALLRIRIAEKQRQLVKQADVTAMLDNLIGILLTGLSGLPARISRDPVTRRNAELVCRQIRTELAQVCEQHADAHGEPSLADQQRQPQETTA